MTPVAVSARTGDHKPVSATGEFRLMLRDRIGPALREAGFRSSSPTWTLTASRGDRALVNVQRSRWSPPGEVEFTVNLSVLPEPWWHKALPTLKRLTDRQQMLAEVRGPGFNLAPLAVLLSDEGPSAELDAVLAEMATGEDEDMRLIYAPMIPWCRENASKVLANRST